MSARKIIGRIQPAGGGRLARTAHGFTLDITAGDVAAAMVAAEPDHPLWTMTKRGHTVAARVRATLLGPELRILLDEELIWSSVIRPATDEALTAAAETKRAEFDAKGWTLA